MFAQTFVDTHVSARKPLTLAASVGLQSMVVATLLIVPLLHPEVLYPKLETPLWIPLKLTPEPPKPQPVKSNAAPKTSAVSNVFHAPAKIPDKVANIVDPAPEAPEAPGIYVPGAGQMGMTGLPPGATMVGLPEKPPAPKPTPVAIPKVPEGPTRVSGGVQAARLTFGPKPLYPVVAKSARVQGTVKLQATIAADGHIEHLQVLSGPGLLTKAAIDAVAQWRYHPTLLGGVPVEVLTEIDVIFSLN